MGDGRYYATRSMCPTCLTLVPGEVVARDGRVYLVRTCPEHGEATGLVCGDVGWYEGLAAYDVAPIRPAGARPAPVLGCPDDCGLCSQHLQIAGTAAIEISNRCNAACPTCLAANRATFELSPDEVMAEVERLLAAQGEVSALALSGGEPALHPRLPEILDRLDRPEIGRIVLNTNGLRIAGDDAFLETLAGRPKLHVCLHYDGPRAEVLRGIPHRVQERALGRLIERGINALPLVLAARDVNDRDLGPLVTGLLGRHPSVRSVIVSMLTLAGEGGSAFPSDPMTRLTLVDALDAMEAGDRAVLPRQAFMPLPMPNPLCAAVGYFLVTDGTLTPLLPYASRDAVLRLHENANYGRADAALEAVLREVIDHVFADPGAVPDGARVLGRLRRLLDDLFPAGRSLTEGERRARAEGHLKTVYLMQFMDAWTFDAVRLRKCSCQHLLPGGKVIPSCGYYTYHRWKDPRFAEAAG